ncbi:MAG: hypothetical protein R3C97_14340, partial [Geminicoccaceae bacterium]
MPLQLHDPTIAIMTKKRKMRLKKPITGNLLRRFPEVNTHGIEPKPFPVGAHEFVRGLFQYPARAVSEKVEPLSRG